MIIINIDRPVATWDSNRASLVDFSNCFYTNSTMCLVVGCRTANPWAIMVSQVYSLLAIVYAWINDLNKDRRVRT